jgi:hypothetical protein
MSAQPWFVGQTSPAWNISLPLDGGEAGPDLTGIVPSNISMIFKNSVGSINTGTGSFKIGTITNGVFTQTSVAPNALQYQPSNADVRTADTYTLYITIIFPNGPNDFGPVFPFVISPF